MDLRCAASGRSVFSLFISMNFRLFACVVGRHEGHTVSKRQGEAAISKQRAKMCRSLQRAQVECSYTEWLAARK